MSNWKYTLKNNLKTLKFTFSFLVGENVKNSNYFKRYIQAAGKMGPGIARLSKDEKWFSSRARGCWPCLDGAAEASSPGSDLVHGDLAATWGSDYFPMVLFGGPTKPKLCINSKILVYTILQHGPKQSVASSNWVDTFFGNHTLCIEHIVELISFLEIIPFVLSTLCQKHSGEVGAQIEFGKCHSLNWSSLIHPSPCFAADIERICWKIPSVPTKDFKRKE